MKRASRFSEREKDLYTILVCLLMICPYVLLVYAETREEKRFTQNMINRRENRIATRTTTPDAPTEPTKGLERRLAEFRKAGEVAANELKLREERFATLKSVDEVKQLRLEITQLADASGVSVDRFGDLHDSEGNDSVEILMEETQNPFNRPIMELEVSSSFSRLATFIRGLKDLSKTVAIVRFDVEAPEFNTSPDAPVMTPLLTARLDLAL